MNLIQQEGNDEKSEISDLIENVLNDAEENKESLHLLINNLFAIGNYKIELRNFSDKLLITHITLWEDNFNILIEHGGLIVCNSMLTFILCAFSGKVDSKLKVSYLSPLIYKSINKIFLHDEISNNERIVRMSLNVITDLLNGIEWMLYSDMSNVLEFKNRTVLFFKDVFSLIQSIKQRIFFFIRYEKDLTDSIFNVSEYYTVLLKKQKIQSSKEEEDDNDSDKETKEEGGEEEEEEDMIKQKQKNVSYNTLFILDMDTKITYLELELTDVLNYLESNQNIELLNVPTNKFTKTLYQKCIEIFDEPLLVKKRKEWMEKLQMHRSYERIFKFRYGLSVRKIIPERAVFVANNTLCELNHCKDIAEMKKSNPRISSDALLDYYDMQHEKLINLLIEDDIVKRHQILNIWSLKLQIHNQSLVFHACSLTEVFYQFCKIHKDYGVSNYKNIRFKDYWEWME